MVNLAAVSPSVWQAELPLCSGFQILNMEPFFQRVSNWTSTGFQKGQCSKRESCVPLVKEYFSDMVVLRSWGVTVGMAWRVDRDPLVSLS